MCVSVVTHVAVAKQFVVHCEGCHPCNTQVVLQAILLDSFYGTERGLTVSSEARAEISELITQLEGKTPTPVPTEARHLTG